ncbi:MAG: hypothetical protein ABJF50_14710 [Paracoccaceae bacterium]
MKNASILIALLLAMSACGPWPQVDAPQHAEPGAWPALLPMEEIAPLSRNDGTAQAEGQRLSNRAAALRNRARLMRQSVPDQDAMDAMRSRLAR